MKKAWSSRWLSSVQPRKQRKYRCNAPLHVRQRFVSVNLSPELRKRFGKRSMQVRKGDEVKVVRGSHKKKTGTVERVDLRKSKIYVDEIKAKKVDGSDVQKPLQPSNLMITKLKLDDKKRQAILDRVQAKTPGPAGAAPEKTAGTSAETGPAKQVENKAQKRKPAAKPEKTQKKKPAADVKKPKKPAPRKKS